MRTMRIFGITVLTALAALAALAAPSQARDRNHDRIGDRWERTHHLSLKVNQARRDQDHDGLKNRGEFRAQTDPRDDDSDNDGIEDGDEQSGTITAISGDKITITLFGATDTVTGHVTSATEVDCDTGGDDDGHGGDDDDEGSKSSFRGDDEHGDDEGENGDDEHGDDDGDHESDDEACPAGALKVGAIVQEAELKLGGGTAVFRKIELVG